MSQLVDPAMLAARVFSKPAGDPGSCRLEIDSDSQEASALCEMLTIILMQGMRQLFGPTTSWATLTAAQILILKKYFLSMGFRFYLDKFHDMPREKTHFQEAPHLADCAARTWNNGTLYLVHFDFWKDYE